MLLLLAIIYISFISLGLPDSMIGSIWPSMYEGMKVPISYAGIISMIVAGGTILSSLLSVRLIRKLGTGLVTAISVAMTAVALFGFSISNNFIELCIFGIPLGLGAGSVDAALNNYVALHYKAKHMSWLHCFWGLGATIGPIIISYSLRSGHWKLGCRTISIIQFTLVIILFLSLPLWKKVSARTEASHSDTMQTHAYSLKELIKLPGVKMVLLAFFSYCAIESTTGLWGSSFLVVYKGIKAETAARFVSLFYFGITFGRFLSGFFTFKLNQRQMVRMGQAVLVVGIGLLMIPGTNTFLLPGLFLVGLGCAPIFPSLIHETPDNFGAAYSQSIMGVQMASAYVGTTFMPPLFGFLASHTSYGLFQFYIAILLIFMFVMVERLHKVVDKAKKQDHKLA
jgi:Fucose permease